MSLARQGASGEAGFLGGYASRRARRYAAWLARDVDLALAPHLPARR